MSDLEELIGLESEGFNVEADQNNLSVAEMSQRLQGVLVVLNPAIRFPDDLARARSAWCNATAGQPPSFLTDEHYLVPRFIDLMLSLRSATTYKEISTVVTLLQQEFQSYSDMPHEMTPMPIDVENSKRLRGESQSLSQDEQPAKRPRVEDDEKQSPPRAYAWNEPREARAIGSSSSISSSVDHFLEQFEASILGENGMLNVKAVERGCLPDNAQWIPPPSATTWTSSQCARFAKMLIPTVPLQDSAEPDLLLYLLGDLAKLDPDIEGRLQRLEKSAKETILNNTSGSGKTRLLWELSCRHWTFYFSLAWHESTNPYGSRDLDDALKMFTEAHRVGPTGESFRIRIVEQEGSSLQAEIDRWFSQWKNNAAVAEQVYQLVLLARLLIYQRFRRLAANMSEADAMRAWCLLQVCPAYSGMHDVFCGLLHQLAHLSEDSATHEIERILGELQIAGQLPYALIFDEAQAAAQKFTTSFGSTLPNNVIRQLGQPRAVESVTDTRQTLFAQYCRPLLKPIVNSIRKQFILYLDSCRTFIAGTKLHRDHVTDALASSVGKAVKFDDYIEFGGQDNPAKIRAVLLHYLGGTVVKQITALQWEELNYWLQGRHRFVSIFVYGVLMSGRHPQQMMNVLSNMLKKLTGHALVGHDHKDLFFIRVDAIIPTLIKEPSSINEGQRHFLSNSMLEFIIKGKALNWAKDDQELVSLGLARITVQTKESQNLVIVNEHLVLVTLFHWLRGNKQYSPLRSWLDHSMANSQRSSAGFSFEDVMLFLFWDWFGDDGRPLDEIFDFKSFPTPAWASENAQLISVFCANSADGNTQLVHKLHTGALAFCAETPDATLDWFFARYGLDQKATAQCRCPILKPDEDYGGDVVFGLLLQSGIEILVCVQCKFWSSVHYKGEIEKELWKLSPEGFYKGDVNSSLKLKFDKMLEMFRATKAFVKRPKPGTPSHPDQVKYDPYPPKYRVLRVLAAFSDTVKVPDEIFETGAVGCYPVALLSSSAMRMGSSHFSSFKRAVQRAEAAEEEEREAKQKAADGEAARKKATIADDAEGRLRRSPRNAKK